MSNNAISLSITKDNLKGPITEQDIINIGPEEQKVDFNALLTVLRRMADCGCLAPEKLKNSKPFDYAVTDEEADTLINFIEHGKGDHKLSGEEAANAIQKLVSSDNGKKWPAAELAYYDKLIKWARTH